MSTKGVSLVLNKCSVVRNKISMLVSFSKVQLLVHGKNTMSYIDFWRRCKIDVKQRCSGRLRLDSSKQNFFAAETNI